MNLINFLADPSTSASTDYTISSITNVCDQNSPLYFVVFILYKTIRIIQIAVPFALIIWGSIDFFKAVIAGDEKEMKAKRRPFIHRLIAAVIVLVLPVLINIIMKFFAKQANNTFGSCWTTVSGDNGANVKVPGSEDTANGTSWDTNTSGS